MHHILWEYEVRADRVTEFEAHYGPDGAWCALFRGAEGYRGTELYRDTARPAHFVTIDHWTSSSAFQESLPTVREAYHRLDEEGASLTLREQRLGAFED